MEFPYVLRDEFAVPAISMECKACRGQHRPHTCGKTLGAKAASVSGAGEPSASADFDKENRDPILEEQPEKRVVMPDVGGQASQKQQEELHAARSRSVLGGPTESRVTEEAKKESGTGQPPVGPVPEGDALMPPSLRRLHQRLGRELELCKPRIEHIICHLLNFVVEHLSWLYLSRSMRSTPPWSANARSASVSSRRLRVHA